MEKQMTNLIEISREQIEQIVRDEIDFLIKYEGELGEPDQHLIESLITVRKQFEPIIIDI